MSKEMVHQVPIEFGGHNFPTSMIVLKGQEIDVILGMNWMAQRGVVLDTLHPTIKIPLPNENSYLLIQLVTPKRTIGQVHAANVSEVKDIPVVRDFPNVFPEDLPGLPPDRDVQFSIKTRDSPNISKGLQNGTERAGRIKNPITRAVAERFYSAQFFSMGLPSLVCEKERSNIKAVCQLSSPK